MTTKTEIGAWFDRGLQDPQQPTHMIIVCDTYDHEDFPIYVLPTEDVHQVYKSNDGSNMQRVMEVYNLKEDKQKQMNQARCFNF